MTVYPRREPPVGKLSSDIDLGIVEQLDAATIHAARVTVASYATGPDDLRMLLDELGLGEG